jgi:hypothetical protein
VGRPKWADLVPLWRDNLGLIGTKKQLIMRLTEHIAASAAASAGIYAATKSPEMAVYSFIAGILIDADHLLDYWSENSFNLNISRFFKTCNECHFTITRLYFHSIEGLILLCAVSYFTRSVLITAVTLGMAQHMAFDQYKNKVFPSSYFFLYRLFYGFKAVNVFSNLKSKEI